MKREDAMQILKIYKDEIGQRIDKADTPDIKDVYQWQLDGFDMAIEALQAETIPLSVADKISEERERLQEKVAELQEKNADRPHGEWLYRWNDVECSECGEFEKKKSNYCPNCGAVMGTVMKEDRE